MSRVKVKFLEAGTWMDEPHKPVFDVAEGEVVRLTAATAAVAVESGKAEWYIEPVAEEDEEVARPKGKIKPKPAGPVPKAEG